MKKRPKLGWIIAAIGLLDLLIIGGIQISRHGRSGATQALASLLPGQRSSSVTTEPLPSAKGLVVATVRKIHLAKTKAELLKLEQSVKKSKAHFQQKSLDFIQSSNGVRDMSHTRFFAIVAASMDHMSKSIEMRRKALFSCPPGSEDRKTYLSASHKYSVIAQAMASEADNSSSTPSPGRPSGID